ncbi:hypothetical protein CL651_001470 [bacterium]|nr:hypothetical protein [bacterium]|tara:strand:- start:236 stop:382 length:147 start_codon:yes stop_codon:yes gene_type:complete
MKRQKQSSKAEYLAKYDKAMQPIGSLGNAVVAYALLVVCFIGILVINL